MGDRPLRRKFASDNLGLGADVLAQMGGWVDIGIIIKAYQRPTTRQLRDVMKTRDAERWARPADQPRDA